MRVGAQECELVVPFVERHAMPGRSGHRLELGQQLSESSAGGRRECLREESKQVIMRQFWLRQRIMRQLPAQILVERFDAPVKYEHIVEVKGQCIGRVELSA